MTQVDGSERVTLSRVYELLMKERDRTDERLNRFEDQLQTMGRQVSEIHTMVAGFPCLRHEEEIEDLQKGQKSTGGYQVTLNLGDLGKAWKVGAAAIATLGVVLAALRDHVGTFLAGGRTP